MTNAKNKIGNITNSNIKEINQFSIKQQTNYLITNGESDRFLEMAFSHTLSPFYIVDFIKNPSGKYSLYSKPTTEESKQKYPINYKISFSVIDERFKNIDDKKVCLDMLYHVDSPVEIKIEKFEQYLGDVLDPYPNYELSPMQEGVKSYIMPQKRILPKVEWDVDIYFKNSKFRLPNIKLKLTNQLTNDRFIFDNYSQTSSPVFIKLDFEFIGEKLNCKLNYKINKDKEKDCKTVLIYNTFILNMLTKKYAMYDRKKKKDIMSGTSKKATSKEETQGLCDYIKIVERIMKIENYFGVKFSVPQEISKEDVTTINHLYRYIIDSEKNIMVNNLRCSFYKKDVHIEQIQQLSKMNETSIMRVSENLVFNILDIDIKIKKVKEIYENVKCSNVAQVNRFIEDYNKLDDNSNLEITMVPVTGKSISKTTEIIK